MFPLRDDDTALAVLDKLPVNDPLKSPVTVSISEERRRARRTALSLMLWRWMAAVDPLGAAEPSSSVSLAVAIRAS